MYKHGLKRVIDFILVFIVLVVIWPILLLITIGLYFANKGAGAFFTQERPGKDGRIFRLIKFKSMTDERDAEGKLYFPEKGSRIYRKIYLDEYPRSEEHTSELQSRLHLVCRLLLEKTYRVWFCER